MFTWHDVYVATVIQHEDTHQGQQQPDISPHLQPQKEWIEIAHVCGSHFDSIKPLLPVSSLYVHLFLLHPASWTW